MKPYHVAYFHSNGRGQFGFGNITFEFKKFPLTEAQMKVVRGDIERQANASCVIISIIPMAVDKPA